MPNEVVNIRGGKHEVVNVDFRQLVGDHMAEFSSIKKISQ